MLNRTDSVSSGYSKTEIRELKMRCAAEYFDEISGVGKAD